MACSNTNFWLNPLPHAAHAKNTSLSAEASKCDRGNLLRLALPYDAKKTHPTSNKTEEKNTTTIGFEHFLKKQRMRFVCHL